MDQGVFLVIVITFGGVFGLFLIFLCVNRLFGFNCVKDAESESEYCDDAFCIGIDDMSRCTNNTYPVQDIEQSPSLKSCRSWRDEEVSDISIGEDNHSLLFQYPECHASTAGHYDWGPGLVSCAHCHKAPILNRGCKTCSKRMCIPCFDAHKNKRVNTEQLSQIILQLYKTKGSNQLTREQWSCFCSCVKAPRQFESAMKSETVDQKQLIDLLDQHPLFAVNSNKVLNHIINRKKSYHPPEKSMGMPDCADEKMHDWGPGIASCSLCNTKTFNRGCRNCNKKLCSDCFKLHMQMAKLAGEALNGTLDEDAHEDVAVEAAHKAVQENSEAGDTSGIKFPPNFAKLCPVAAHKKEQSRVIHGFDFLTPENMTFLSHGGALYACVCRPGSTLTHEQLAMAASFVNISSFRDETKENSVPYLDPHSESSSKHIFLLNKGMYCMGGDVNPEVLNPHVFSSVKFHNECQPGSGFKKTTVWRNVEEPNTFRLTKPVIPVLFTITFQLRCSIVPKDKLQQLSVLCDGIAVHHALLMERTKRVKSTNDSTLKLKSILCYHFLPDGGALVTNVTCAINKSVPAVAAKLVDNLASMGCHEVYETAEKTRRYLVKLSSKIAAKDCGS